MQKYINFYKKTTDEIRLFILTLFITSIIGVIVGVNNIIFDQKSLGYIILGFTLFCLIIVGLIFLQKLSYDYASRTLVILIFMLMMYTFYTTEGKVQAGMYLMAFPLALIILRPSREWSLGIVVFAFTMILGKTTHMLHAEYTFNEMAQILLALGIISLFLGLYVEGSRGTKKELAVQRSKLKALNGQLETVVARRTKDLKEANEQLQRDLIRDSLTQMLNKRGFAQNLREEILRHREDHKPFSMIEFDLDDFQKVNHYFGREIGDEILVKVAKIAAQNVRQIDTIARVSGDGFAIIMHNTQYEDAMHQADMIRRKLEWAVFLDNHQITGSFGVIEIIGDEDEYKIMNRADLAMQRAKHRGKNRVVCVQEDESDITIGGEGTV